MSSQVSSPEITHAPEHASGTGRIWKTFWVLSFLTVIELALGYLLYWKHGTVAIWCLSFQPNW